MELLAPAGTIEAFDAAIAAGADAVYFGAPRMNARAMALPFSLDEMAAMIRVAHDRYVKVYMAINSLMLERETAHAVEILAAFETFGGDAVIIQDLGVYRLARRHYPRLRLHASTLMGAQNGIAVQTFQEMGFSRVVLGRELSLSEIAAIRAQTGNVELEVFAHGAMCFGYSGLCYFSSFLGGKSGLRGRCVQPCRRRYSIEGKTRKQGEGIYLFSMNDLCTLDFLGDLAEAGVVSLKIEGRMRSAHYVGCVVKAYRLALDAFAAEKKPPPEAYRLLGESMGRKTGKGYYFSAAPHELLSPRHSGNIGIFLGKIKKSSERDALLLLQSPLMVGDRLRLHREETGERYGFSLKSLILDGKAAQSAGAGSFVRLRLPVKGSPGDSLYKVDGGEEAFTDGSERRLGRLCIKRVDRKKKEEILVRRDHVLTALHEGSLKKGEDKARQEAGGNPLHPKVCAKRRATRRTKGASAPGRMEWWLKIDDLKMRGVLGDMPLARIVLTLSPKTFSQFRNDRKGSKIPGNVLTWALPPIIDEALIPFYRNAVSILVRLGHHRWQLSHIGQVQLFKPSEASDETERGGGRKKGKVAQLDLTGDSTLNVMNVQAVIALREMGFSSAQISMESDRQSMAEILGADSGMPLGLTVYGRPILCMARTTAGFFPYGSSVLSPRGERFFLRKIYGRTAILPEKPFSLLNHVDELMRMGLRYAVIDLSSQALGRGEQKELVNVLHSRGKGGKFSTINYSGSLL